MKITAEKNAGDAVLVLTVEGSIDTVTAPELEHALSGQFAGLSKLVFDFSAVDYVSSAGLRVIMAADRQMGSAGRLILKHVSEDVREVFSMTGFDELLTFE